MAKTKPQFRATHARALLRFKDGYIARQEVGSRRNQVLPSVVATLVELGLATRIESTRDDFIKAAVLTEAGQVKFAALMAERNKLNVERQALRDSRRARAKLTIRYWRDGKECVIPLAPDVDVIEVRVAAVPGHDEHTPDQPELKVTVNTDMVLVDNDSGVRIGALTYSEWLLLAEAAEALQED